MTTGIDRIAEERRRQIEEEGWTAEHDREHADGALATAGACYALDAVNAPLDRHQFFSDLPAIWPWSPHWWKPTPGDPVRQLVKAGALIAAEIDRRLRALDAPEEG